jgi:hypothetical protein
MNYLITLWRFILAKPTIRHKTIFMFLFMFSSLNLFGQDIQKSKTTWTVTGLTDLTTKESMSYTCSFTLDGEKDILWSQGNGKNITPLQISKVTGKWSNINGNGKVIYSFSMEGEKGSLEFKRTSAGVFVILDLSPGTEARQQHQFTVSEIKTDSN